MTSADDANRKAALRRQAMARRQSLPAAIREAAGAAIAERAGAVIARLGPARVVAYWPIGSECPTQLLMAEIAATGAEIGLPAVVGERELAFRRYISGDRLAAASFGTREPLPDAVPVSPDLIVLPLVGFDRRGMRLGYGRGYYDSAISRLREAGQDPILVGIAFSVQEVDTIPAESHDVRLDYIVTEKETLEFRTSRG